MCPYRPCCLGWPNSVSSPFSLCVEVPWVAAFNRETLQRRHRQKCRVGVYRSDRAVTDIVYYSITHLSTLIMRRPCIVPNTRHATSSKAEEWMPSSLACRRHVIAYTEACCQSFYTATPMSVTCLVLRGIHIPNKRACFQSSTDDNNDDDELITHWRWSA